MLTKLDLKKTFKTLYNPSAKEFSVVDVPAMNFLMIDGAGDPNTATAYKEAVEALYAASYTLKFAIKKQLGVDYPVMPLQGLWWADDMKDFLTGRREDWRWTMMIMQPEMITLAHVDAAIKDAQAKKGLPGLARLRFEPFTEGLAAQIMYFGLYRDEGPTIARLHEFIAVEGGALSGKHHEIYLSDPRKTAPDKLKTVIRQPFRR
ncbi:MAG: GyrI-like domain-containing protein [Anaerolineae bacterium]|nr:GyrI-like domain-containing protein [Anaerolineae bacterium]